jgi:hypothetical protein
MTKQIVCDPMYVNRRADLTRISACQSIQCFATPAGVHLSRLFIIRHHSCVDPRQN